MVTGKPAIERKETAVVSANNVAIPCSRLALGQTVTATGDDRSSPTKRTLHGVLVGLRVGVDGRIRVDLNLAGGYNATLAADEVRIDCETVTS